MNAETKKRFTSLLLLIQIVAGAFTHVSADTNHSILKVAVLKNFPPQYSISAEGEPEGFAVDVIREIARLLNRDIRFVVKENWSEAFDALRSGEADLIPNQGVTEDRKQWFDFTSPVETFPVRIFVRSASNGIREMADLKGKNVGVIRLNVGETLLSGKSGINVMVYEHLKDALYDLLSGHLDAIVFPEPVLRRMARQARLEERITAVGPPLIEIKRAISVRKGDKNLLDSLNSAVKRFVGSPAYEKIYKRWYGEPSPPVSVRQLGAIMGLTILLIVVAMTLWRYRSLRRLNVNLIKNIDERERVEKKLKEARDRLEDRVRQRTRALTENNRELQLQVDKRTQAERLLKEKEQFLTSIFDSIQDGISVLDLELKIVRTNRAMENWYAEHLPLTDKLCFNVYRGLPDPCDHCPTLRAIKSCRIEMQEVPLIQDGVKTGVLELFAFPMIDPDGHVTGVVEYVRDISQRKRAENALADYQRRLADIIEFLPDPTWVVDRQGCVIAWNKAIEKLTGVRKQDILGQGNYAHSIPFYGERRPSLIDLVIKRDKTWESRYIRIKEKDGLLIASESYHPVMGTNGIYLSGTAGRLYDSKGNVVGAIETVRDITDAKLLEQERERLISDLQDALARVQTLTGLLPICASCKKIRDDKGYWNQIESYISRHSEAEFSHSICPECVRKLYPELKIFK